MKAEIITKGEGIDELANDCIQLDLKWFWGWHGHKEKKPSQVCAAYLDDFEFRVIHWHNGYESELAYMGKILRIGEMHDKTYQPTRKKAQIVSEMLLFDMMKVLTKAAMKLKKK